MIPTRPVSVFGSQETLLRNQSYYGGIGYSPYRSGGTIALVPKGLGGLGTELDCSSGFCIESGPSTINISSSPYIPSDLTNNPLSNSGASNLSPTQLDALSQFNTSYFSNPNPSSVLSNSGMWWLIIGLVALTLIKH